MCLPPALPPTSTWSPLIERALEEDVGPGDRTGDLTIPADARGAAQIEARQELVVCGIPIVVETFRARDPSLSCKLNAGEGQTVPFGAPIIEIAGPLRSILAAERSALNFFSRMSGIATSTRRYVEAVRGTAAQIVDTRKTVPGWRHLDKYATAVGGAQNHRMGLFDGILIKDNHIAIAGGVENAVRIARGEAPEDLFVQVEVQSEEEAIQAVDAGADFLLLDNFSAEAVGKAVRRLGDRALLEASGGIHLENVRAYAETGVPRISIGALTHSAPGADVSLEMSASGGSG